MTSVSILADKPDNDPSAEISWRADDHGHAVSDVEVRRVGGGVVPCAGAKTGSSCRVSLAGAGRDQQFQVRLFNRANPERGRGIDGWGEWSSATTKVTGATTPGPVQNLRIAPTGKSGEATVSFDYSDAQLNNADKVEFFTNRTGGTVKATGTGSKQFTITGLNNGSNVSVDVWAKTYANVGVGGGSAESERRSGNVSTFAPCTIDVSNPRSGYRSVTFDWRVSANGRNCAWSGNHGFPSGSGGSRNGIYKVDTAGDGQGVTLTLRATTQVGNNEPGVGASEDSASGTTFSPRASSYYDSAPNNTGNCRTDCSYFALTLQEFPPGKVAYCPITHVGSTRGGQTWWYRTGTADSNGHWRGRINPGGAYNTTQFSAYPGWSDANGGRCATSPPPGANID